MVKNIGDIPVGPEVLVEFFDANKLPAVIEPRQNAIDAVEWCTHNRVLIRKLLSRHGAVLLRGFHVGSLDNFDRAFQLATSDKIVQYRDKATPRTHLAGNVYTSTEYDCERTIFPHNENSFCIKWPLYIGFYAVLPPVAAGATPLVDCRKVCREIPEILKRRFEANGILYSRRHGRGFGMDWRHSYSVTTLDEMRRYCQDNVMDFRLCDEDVISLKFRRWASVTHPITNEKAWFNHGVFFNVDALEPELKEVFLSCYDESQLPYNTCYGDGTRIEPHVTEQIYGIYMSNRTRFDYRHEDVLIVDNMLVAHGRESYAGQRKICVSMSEQVWARSIAECRPYLGLSMTEVTDAKP